MLENSPRQVAKEAVLAASKLCRTIQHELTSADTLIKKDRSPVTVADFSSQIVITYYLRKAFPDVPIVAEEEADDLTTNQELCKRVCHYVRSVLPDLTDEAITQLLQPTCGPEERPNRFWTLDPIDGTKGFLRGEQYAVSLALIDGGQPILGVLGCPNLPLNFENNAEGCGLLFLAEHEMGAVTCPVDNSETESAILPQSRPLRLCESVESAHTSHTHSQQLAQALDISEPSLRIDSQCKYAVVARGDASLYLRLPVKKGYEEKIWDHAAGFIVLKESGGTITDINGMPIDFSQGPTLRNNKGIVASQGADQKQILDSLGSLAK